ncbi:MAG TPA: hypothetical protein VFW71_13305 [Actinomycetota bacterium]|nr:hypothetical protein [Actinomycetota bacterium]
MARQPRRIRRLSYRLTVFGTATVMVAGLLGAAGTASAAPTHPTAAHTHSGFTLLGIDLGGLLGQLGFFEHHHPPRPHPTPTSCFTPKPPPYDHDGDADDAPIVVCPPGHNHHHHHHHHHD